MIGIIISLVLLIFLVYRGVSVLIVSPLMAMLAVALGSDMPMVAAWTGPFMDAAVGFIGAYFPVFLVGAIFGSIMNTSGAALIIARFISNKMGSDRAMLAVIIASFLLTYGGVSVFVVVFAVLPIAKSIFIANDYPRHMLPAAICAGALPAYVAPGSAQFINTIPMPIFNTNIYSGMFIGIIGTVVWLAFAICYMNHLVKKAKLANEGYGENTDETTASVTGEGSIIVAMTPIMIVIVGNFLLTKLFERQDMIDYYAEFGGVQGIWAITISLCVAVIATLALYWNKIDNKAKSLSQGATDALAPIFNTGTQVGFGGVIKILPAFAVLKGLVFAIPGSQLIAVAVGTAVLAGIVGSTSGGVGLTMLAFGPELVEIAAQHNISLDVMHRMVVFSASMLDTLPHSGFIITLLAVCGLTHKQSYKDLFLVSCLFPMFAVAAMIVSATLGIN